VREGGSVTVSGTGTPPFARAWAELYEDTDFRDRSVVFDWDDRLADDFDDFDALDEFDDEASSLIFRAPVGCSLQVYADRAYGGRRLALNGTGGVVRVPDLHAAAYGFADETGSVQWVGSSCPATALGYVWFPGGVQGSTATLRPTWDGPSDHTLLLQVCGRFLACAEDEAALHVQNVAPAIASLTVPATVAEGARIDVTGSFTDPGSLERVLTVTFEWGDGSSDSFTASSISWYHRYADNGVKSLRVRVCDEFACDTQVRNVTVTNVAPTDSAGNDATVAEGVSFSPGSSFSDAGWGSESFRASIDWGDRTTSTPAIISVPGAPLRATIGSFLFGSSHRYGDDGTYTVTVTVTDDDGGVGSDTLVVTVTNAAPVVGTLTLRDEAGRVLGSGEAALVGLRVDVAAALTDGAGDTHTATISWGDGQTSAAIVDQATRTVRGAHVYANAAPSRAVILSAADADGASGQASAQVAVADAAGALAAAIDDVRPLSNDPTVPAAAHQALRSALSALEGSNGGAGNDGAVDWLAAGELLSALDRIRMAIQYLQSAEVGYPPLDAVGIEALLTLTAKSVTVAAIADAQPLATTSARQAAIVQATTLVGEGDALLAAGDRLAAARKYLLAVRAIATYF
jgi:PKD domain